MFNNIYQGTKVLITGHTGFKGSWLALWLVELGAKVIGYGLDPPTSPNHFDLLTIPVKSVIGDIRDISKLSCTINRERPEIVFHMAAQPLVRKSYRDPKETFETNVIGTVNVFEACRLSPSIKAVINITSDKCYENKEWVWGYRENDPMGGYDPYSASKGCSELVTSSYSSSFFNRDDYGKKHSKLIASVRAGNVIGGGDWAEDRLVPDIMHSTSINESVIIRNPKATRPWQHVLEPLSGYLEIGEKLLEGKIEFAEAWNFGPGDEGSVTVQELVEGFKKIWKKIDYRFKENKFAAHEANFLKLDCSKAKTKLEWKSIWDSKTAFEKTAEWYMKYYQDGVVMSMRNLLDYFDDYASNR